jgi:plasmid stabilization system protein ParE
MTLPIIWTAPARAQIAELYDYIAESSLSAADHQVATIADSANRLAIFSEIGRPGRRSGTRELVIAGTPYIVVYRIRESTVRILAVMHGAQRWPRMTSR